MKKHSINITHQESLRANLLIWLFEISKPIYREIFKRNATAWAVKKSDLNNHPHGSLGRALGNFLTFNGFEVEPKLESHDVTHVLLNYNTDVVDEICLQYFYIGSGKKSIYSFGTFILGILILPEYYTKYLAAFKRGQTAINFSKWDFEHLLKEPIVEIRKLIFNKESSTRLYI